MRSIARNPDPDLSKLAEQLAQARALTRRYEANTAKKTRAAYSALAHAEVRASDAEASVKDAEARSRDAEARARDAEARARDAEARARDAEACAKDAMTLAQSYYVQLEATLASKSWLITKPLRWWFDLLMSMRDLPGKSNGSYPNDKSFLAAPSELRGLTPRAREIYGHLLKSNELVSGRKP
jgi:hypothetical protein